MKKMTSGYKLVSQGAHVKVVLLTFFALACFTLSNAQKTSTGSGDWNNAATWTPAGVPGAGDNVIIANGHNVRVNAAANCANMTINAGGTLRLDGNQITVAGNWTNNGTFTCQQQNNTNEIVTFTGAAATIGGSSTTSFSGLRINTTGTVTLTANAINVGTGQHNAGRITLQSGFFDVGVGHSINLVSQQTTNIDASGGGRFVSYGPGGWTLNNAIGFGGQLVTTGRVELDNITPTTTYGNNDCKINNQTGSSATTGLQLNGVVSASGTMAQNWAITGNAPVWGANSTLYIDRQNQQFALGQNGDLSWVAMASGTVGVTPGYPNNVTLVNMGNSAGDAAGFYPSGNLSLNGTLSVGDGTTNGVVSLGNLTSFNSGGITVNHNSTLKGPPAGATFIDRGNFTLAGATTGVFTNNGASINFAGSGTIGSPQTISTTGTSITFTSMTVSNGTYVSLQDDVSISSTLTLTSGYIGTSATNSLTVNNTATAAVTGGSSTAYVDGPLSWSIPATTTNSYVFPIGDRANGGAYLPLTLSPNSTSGSVVTAEAFNANSGGVPDATITTISTTEYWSVTTSSAFTSSPLVSVSRPTAVSPNNAMGLSSSASGVYTAIGGTPSGTTMSGGAIGTGSPAFIVLVVAPLSVVKLGGTHVTCNGTTGSLIVGGSGGTAPYTYSINGGAYQVSNTFTPLTPGDYSVRVKDNTGTIALTVMKVLGSILINGNDQDVAICPPNSTTLTASNLLNNTPTYTWSLNSSGTPVAQTGATYNVSPATTTRYYVFSKLYNTNVLSNPSFESGNTGFTSGYTLHTTGQYATTPGNGGLYTITSAGTTQCQFFSMTGAPNATALSAQSGALYFVGDGNIASSMVWSQTVTGLTVGEVYKFNYWYAAGNPDAVRATLRFTAIGGTIASVAPTTSVDITTTNSTAWTQATYNVTATATSITVTLTNITNPGNTNGNDFFLDNMEFLTPCTVSTSVQVIPDCSLPVELVTFNAVNQGEGALVTWATSSEINSSYFTITKSLDGKTFTPIGTVNAAGTSTALNTYSFTDPYITAGVTYYQLIQYDIDGSAYYSEVKAVTKDQTLDVQVSPNPTNGTFVVTLGSFGDKLKRIYLLNSLGQVVFVEAEFNGNEKSIDISNLASGIYYLHVGTDEDNIVKKIIKE